MLKTLELQDLSCGNCAVTVRTALNNKGFTSVKVNIINRPHSVTAEINDDEHLELLKVTLRDHGYYLIDDEVELPDHTGLNFA